MPRKSLNRLVLFTRYPQAGTTKTRLIPVLGAEGAAELQRRMSERVVSQINEFSKLNSAASYSIEIRFEGGSEALMRAWLGAGFDYRLQGDGDIGLRMAHAFRDGFADGCQTVAVVGSDIPRLSSDLIRRAFENLESRNLVLGPAGDGGYYLIGLHSDVSNRTIPRLFDGIPWGTANVLPRTLKRVGELGLTCTLLDTLDDVDRPEDLAVWNRIQTPQARIDKKKWLSIIIPTLNEAEIIGEALSDLPKSETVEVIVVDGGSRDRTIELAASLGVRVLTTTASKARQMNAGAEDASGAVLLFLHADTRLPEAYEEKIRTAVNRNGFRAGAFTLKIDADHWGLRVIERVANWRSRYLRMPYGDQALFVRRETFREIGGFPACPIMEDFELVRRLRRKGGIVILPDYVRTSARRYLNFGIFKSWMINQTIVAAYCLGVGPERLARWYRREKRNPPVK